MTDLLDLSQMFSLVIDEFPTQVNDGHLALDFVFSEKRPLLRTQRTKNPSQLLTEHGVSG